MKIDVLPNPMETEKDEIAPTKRCLPKVQKKVQEVVLIASEFSQTTSINGILFINISQYTAVKLVWSLLFISALGAMLFHSYWTVADYLSYKTKTTVAQSLQKSIQLPFVTICNINPIRLSKVNESSLQVKNDVARLSFENFLKKHSELKNLTKESNTGDEDFYSYWTRIVSTSLKNNDQENTTDMYHTSTSKNLNFGEISLLLASINKNAREHVGHQISDMLLSCTFKGFSCTSSNFKVLQNDNGNCYTLNTTEFEQNREGAFQGLTLELFLEPDEYISEIIKEKGFIIAVHEPESYSFPAEDGFLLMPGTRSYVALKLVQTTHLQSPYGECFDDSDNKYLKKYTYKYNNFFCDAIGNSEYIQSICKCRDDFAEHVFQDNRDNFSLCQDDEEANKCFNEYSDTEAYICDRTCSENIYQQQITSSQWPTSTQAKVMVEYICSRPSVSSERCERLRNQSERDMRENFLSLRIYYDSMYVDIITDEPDVSLTTFLSNLGGCIGLWIGLSVLSLAEVLQFLSQLFWAFCSRKKKNDT